ncbi:hypothetical protein M422DRAFT_240971 [Sphaerobolus stellatus SS14]|nr:hypothetical protein M422DRAFT_240971 [Sphaerobolus stellatus SS14]
MAVSKQLMAFLGFDLYFFKSDQSPYILWASLLEMDPRINLQQVLYDYQDDPELLPEIRKQKIELEQYYEANFAEKIRNELQVYFQLLLKEFNSTNPMKWWGARKAQFPTLNRLTRNILSIPESTVAVEHIFSGVEEG